MRALTYNIGKHERAYENLRLICNLDPVCMLTMKVGVMMESSVDATAELLLDPARCARARMSSQIEVKMPILLGADAVALQMKRSSPTRHG